MACHYYWRPDPGGKWRQSVPDQPTYWSVFRINSKQTAIYFTRSMGWGNGDRFANDRCRVTSVRERGDTADYEEPGRHSFDEWRREKKNLFETNSCEEEFSVACNVTREYRTISWKNWSIVELWIKIMFLIFLEAIYFCCLFLISLK